MKIEQKDIDTAYLKLLTTTNFFEKSKGNFFYDITGYEYDPETRHLIIEGWAFNRPDEEGVDFEIVKNQAEVVSFERTVFDIPKEIPREKVREGEKLGFKIELVLPEGTEESHRFPLVITDPATGQKHLLEARDDMHYRYSRQDMFDYYRSIVKTRGARAALEQYKLQGDHIWDAYNQWYHSKPAPDKESIKADIRSFSKEPKISIVVPVYDVDEIWLRKTIDSVRNQYYENWELCLADDASPSEHIKPILSEYAAKDDRIKVVFREENGHISEATNSALSLATGDYIGFMDHDDEIEPDTLYEYVKAINEDSERDFIYCDQDFIDTEDYRYEPFYKSHWNPRLLQSQNYVSHFLLVSRDLLEKTGGFRKTFDGSQDYDFTLRASLKANKIHHIPKILYHWRVLETSLANDPEVKSYAYERASRAISNYLKKLGVGARSVVSRFFGINTIVRYDTPPVSIIIVADENALMTLKSVLENTEYPNFEVLAVNFDENEELPKDSRVKYLYNNAPLTREELYDYAADKAGGEILALLNAQTTLENPEWLTSLVNELANPETGIVGGLVKAPDEEILHAGAAFDTASNQMLYCHRGAKVEPGFLGYYFRLIVPQNVVSVSSMMMAIPKALFKELGGFSKEFQRPLSEIDLSLRAMRLGKRTVWTPDSVAVYNGWVSDFREPGVARDGFYMEAEPGEVKPFLERFSEEELEDPYTNDLVKRFRRLASPNYAGPEELRYV